MNLTFRGIGFTPDDDDREFLNKKLKKLGFAEDYLHDLDVVAKKRAKAVVSIWMLLFISCGRRRR